MTVLQDISINSPDGNNTIHNNNNNNDDNENHLCAISNSHKPLFVAVVVLLLMMAATDVAYCQNTLCQHSADNNLTIAVVVSLDSVNTVRRDVLDRALRYAVDRLNGDRVVPGYTLRHAIYDTQCHAGMALIQMDQARIHGAVAFVGPACDSTCVPAGRFARELNMTMVTFACQSTALSSRQVYPYLLRSVGTFLEMARFVSAILTHFDWDRVLLVLNTADASNWLELLDEFNRTRTGDVYKQWMADMTDLVKFDAELAQKVKYSYVFVVLMHPSAALAFLKEVRTQGYFDGGRVYITFGYYGHSEDQLEPPFTGLLDVSMEIVSDSEEFITFFRITNPCQNATLQPDPDRDKEIREHLGRTCSTSSAPSATWGERLKLAQICGPPCFTARESALGSRHQRPVICAGDLSNVTAHDVCCRPLNLELMEAKKAASVVDAVQLLAQGLRAVAKVSCPHHLTANNARIITAAIANLRPTLQGITGPLFVLEDGSRLPSLSLINIVHHQSHTVARADFSTDYRGSVSFLPTPITWPGGGNQVPTCPPDVCPPSSSVNVTSAVLWGIVSAVGAICLLLTFVPAYIRRRRQAATKRDWIISSQKLYSTPAFAGKIGNLTGAGRKSRTRLSGYEKKHMENAKQCSEMNMHLSHDSLHTFVMGQIYARVTILDQQVVAVKQVNVESVEVTPEVISELNMMRSLKHANINQLMGACVDPGSICLVWNYCAKGSLRDVLDNKDIKLDWMFKLSFVTDIARGMSYLHSSPVKLHGRLKSTNVVVDTNWCCKVTDMAMPHFRAGELEDLRTRQYFYNLLWTAPELLCKPAGDERGSKKGDVYSFAIIVHEVYHRCRPFNLCQGMDPRAYVYRVESQERPPYRPRMSDPDEDADSVDRGIMEGVRDLALMCWDEYPLFRPTFSAISQNLKHIQQAFGGTPNLVDQMLMMVRKYADNLEELVEERTQQLEEEKKKTEELLSRMLPKSVAEELKMGRPVIPETYASATLFFSDILDFSNITRVSTPMQVVNLLNDLYICFDKVIETYDAYKVETIADNYVVSSGLPIRNGDTHAAVIACLALDLLVNVLSFSIHHLPDQQLLLRIGIHTGSVVAGVVGKKMPRYCIFGDTVNYTSRMESNGKPLHIHVSPECTSFLEKVGGFILKRRGLVQLKGKGQVLTYFLVGKEGQQVAVPDLRPGVLDMVGININGYIPDVADLPDQQQGAGSQVHKKSAHASEVSMSMRSTEAWAMFTTSFQDL